MSESARRRSASPAALAAGDTSVGSTPIRQRLAAEDSANPRWQRDLSISQDKVGDVFRDQRDLTGALEAYRESLAIRRRLVAQNPPNAGWQRDLSISAKT